MNILLAVHQFLPDYASGTETLALNVARELRGRGHQVWVMTGFPAAPGLPDERRFDCYEVDGIPVHRFHHAREPMGGQDVLAALEYDNRLAAGYFARLVQDLKPGVVHFFHFKRLGCTLVDVAARADIPAYYTPTDFWALCPAVQLLRGGAVCPGPSPSAGNCVMHAAEVSHPRLRGLFRAVPAAAADLAVRLSAAGPLAPLAVSREAQAVSRRASFVMTRLNALHAVLAPSALMADLLIAGGLDPRLVHRSAYGIDIPREGESLKPRAPGAPLTVGYVGTLAPHKGVHVLLEAFRRLDDGRMRLKIYGNLDDFPDYLAKLKGIAGGSGNVEFCGTFPNDSVADVMAGLDTLAVPSVWYENTPLVIYSALAAKRPPVVSDLPGMTEAVKHGVNGLVFRPGDADALAAQLMRLRDEPGLPETLSANCGRPKSIPEYVDDLLALYAGGAPVGMKTRNMGQLQRIPAL